MTQLAHREPTDEPERLFPDDLRGAAVLGVGTNAGLKLIGTGELNGDATNWWVPDGECVLGMLRTVGFTAFSAPVRMGPTRLVVVASKRTESILDLRALA